MQFLQANQRRRRVLSDELSGGDGAADRPAIATASRSHRRIDGYAPAAKPEQQRRVIDFVPCTRLAFGLWIAAGIATVGGLAAAQIWLPSIAGQISAQPAAALDLGAKGSLGGWVASLWLALAGTMSALIYSIRRHKLDDYRGRYRWWIAAAAAWFLMSVDATCGIHELFAATMVHLTGYARPGGGAAWWLGGWGIFLGGLSVRLAWEMRVCRPAMSAYLSALVLWVFGIAIQLSGVRLGAASNALPAEIAKLLGHLSLLLGLTIYARHVILHAQGLLPARKRRSSKEKSTAAVSNKTRTDLQPHIEVRAMAHETDDDDGSESEEKVATPSSRDVRTTSAPHEFEQDEPSSDSHDRDTTSDPDDNGQKGKLSKAERKRLRKLKAQEEQGW